MLFLCKVMYPDYQGLSASSSGYPRESNRKAASDIFGKTLFILGGR